MNLKPIKYKERFEAMKNNPRGVVEYAQSLKHPIPELEHVVLRDELAIYWYAYYVLRKRWPEAEAHMTPTVRNRYIEIIKILHGK